MRRRAELLDQLRHHGRRARVVDLAGAGRRMSAAAVSEAGRPDIDRRASVDDRLADREDGVLLLETPNYMHRDPALREQGVDHESIAGVDGFLVAKIKDDEVSVDGGATQDLLTKLGLMLPVEVDPLCDVRQLENLSDRMIATIVNQLHHQVVVGNAKLPESTEPGARIHQGVVTPALYRVSSQA